MHANNYQNLVTMFAGEENLKRSTLEKLNPKFQKSHAVNSTGTLDKNKIHPERKIKQLLNIGEEGECQQVVKIKHDCIPITGEAAFK